MQTQTSEEEVATGERQLTGLPGRPKSSQVGTRRPMEVPAAEVLHGPVVGDEDAGHDEEEDFEFAVAARGCFDGLEAANADEIFSDGLIRPLYPLFDRALVLDGGEYSLLGSGGSGGGEASSSGEKETTTTPPRLPLRLRELMMEERDAPSASSESESEELEGPPAGSYCVWAPQSAPASPELRRKSHSAGAASKPWRLCRFVVGRSHSDGKERLVFLERAAGSPSKEKAAQPPQAEKKGTGEKKGRGKGRPTEMDMVTAHRLYYARGGAAAGDRRRSFLPYRNGLLGFFPNVNGHSSLQPF